MLTLLLTAFTWPTSEIEPRNLPLAIVAPPPVAAGVDAGLAEGLGESAIDMKVVGSRAAAVEAIRNRDVYGAFVYSPDGTEVLIATAASPLVAQLLTQAAGQMAARQDSAAAPRVTDVVPAAQGDSRGAVFGADALPLALGGITVGTVASVALGRVRDRLIAAVVVAAGASLAVCGVLQGWLDALGESFWANACVIALGVLAVAFPIIGLRPLLGFAGVAVMAVLIIFVGNPLSGVTSGPELLPLGWLGQSLPPGATGTALRGTAFFDGAGRGSSVLVLLGWAGAGLLLAVPPRKE